MFKELVKSAGVPLVIGVIAGWVIWLASPHSGTMAAVVFGTLATIGAAAWWTARRDAPPRWWSPLWGWKGEAPLLSRPADLPMRPNPVLKSPVTPRPRGASALPRSPRFDPNDPHARRATEVQRNLRVAGSLLVGLAGAAMTLGIALTIASAFLVGPGSDDTLIAGLLFLLFGTPARLFGAMLIAHRPPGFRLGDLRVNWSLWLIDLWDCGVTLLWTAAATACVALPAAILRISYEAPVWFGVSAGMLTAAWVTLRRETAPLWWPSGWAWREAGGGKLGGIGTVAGMIGRWPIFHTPPGGLSRPAVWAAGWLMTLLAIPLCMILSQIWRPDGDGFKMLALLCAVPGTFAPLAVPLLGWAAVRQVRTSQARGDDPPIWGRRLAVFDAWIFPAALLVGACVGAACGATSVWHWGIDGRGQSSYDRSEIDLHMGLAGGSGALIGLALAALVWVKLSRASRVPVPPPVRPEPPVGASRDTGAGLSRVFRPRVNPETGRRQWGETIAAVCAAGVVLLVALLWWGARGGALDAPRPATVAGESAAAVKESHDSVHLADPHDMAVAAGSVPLRIGQVFQETTDERTPWYGVLRLNPDARAALGADAEQVEALETAANRIRREWATAMAEEGDAGVTESGSVRFTFPDLMQREDRWEREFYEAVDPMLNVTQEMALRKTLLFGNDMPHNLVQTDSPYRWLVPVGVYTTSATIGRQGEWYDVIAAHGRQNVPGKSVTAPARKLPLRMEFLAPALARVSRGEPAFPDPVAEDKRLAALDAANPPPANLEDFDGKVFDLNFGPNDPWYGRMSVPAEDKRALGLSDAQTAVLTAAGNAARRKWGEAIAAGTTTKPREDGAVEFDFPDLDTQVAKWEREFWAELAPAFDTARQAALRDRIEFKPFSPDIVAAPSVGFTFLFPVGVKAMSQATVAKYGDWYDLIRPITRGMSTHGESLPELPPALRFLAGPLERLERGEPAFPPTTAVPAPEAPADTGPAAASADAP
ncbi:hypothetical protein LzC2_41420 [Planctomycetes bacterium LzC2]|uniref:Uncharacterized protein n=1 Tax=Alienimonas chondri TaxID=2681879 RepID=A0ABX1VIW5_9PLAN|nr:hypothetical protein [Alienimonas chondri]